jgi:predicted RNase H-like HicB family nuclease
MHYVAYIHQEQGSDYGVSFPDFPGCITAGHTLEEALLMAREALEFHIEGLLEEGLPLPDGQHTHHTPPEDARLALIEVALPEAAKRINITLDGGLLKRVDAAVARHQYSSRSAFLAEAARRELAGLRHTPLD